MSTHKRKPAAPEDDGRVSRRPTRRWEAAAARVGDWIEVDGVGGSSPRRGEIAAVLGAPGHIHFRVRWDEEHETLFYPADRGFAIRVKRAPGRRGH